ncbi:hypothetical protein [Phytoactinopolyspora endophytica]|uniref:hypothetical protein n=1 Tax=Phytoactinopolyspora endophytica TaxID=1642495 RepID=UPI00101C2683|nr:hypothetical protein [Phytoactinopolyspora endophytica]
MEDADMVANPEYAALVETLELAQHHRSSIASALEPACIIMERGDAWRGPTAARAFLDDLAQCHQELPGIAERLVDDVREALAGTAEDVPAQRHGIHEGSML